MGMINQRRVIVPGIPYHIIHRGNNRRRLFSYPCDYLLLLRFLKDALERAQCVVHAICLMANHIHLLMTALTETGISRFVQSWAQRYAIRRNRKRKGSGKLFEQRFEDIPITSERQMAITTTYIEVNAWRSNLIDDPINHRWSSYAINAGCQENSWVPAEIITPSRWYLSLGTTEEERAREYRRLSQQFYLGGVEPEHGEIIKQIEKEATEKYTLRLRRPDGKQAR